MGDSLKYQLSKWTSFWGKGHSSVLFSAFLRAPVFVNMCPIIINLCFYVNAYFTHIFIGDPIEPIAESVMQEFKDFTDPRARKKIVNNINDALEKEFLELADEADDLFGIEVKEQPKDAATSTKE
jgi:hypothetical protein